MSKKAFALVLTAVFVFAFATSAFAAWGDSTYLDPASMVSATGEVGGPNPHGPYDTTSRKCAVCHAVHAADPTGGQLLKAGATDPCIFCHITTDAGVKIVYKGNALNYTAASEFAHNNGCKSCHTVHGAGATTVSGAAANLKGLPQFAGSASRPGVDYTALSTASTGAGPYTLTQWCSGCHPYLATGQNDVSHVMTTSVNANYSNPNSTVNVKVAWAASGDCTSCHDATAAGAGPTRTPTAPATLTTKNFPHYTNGSRFLLEGGDFDAGKTAVGAGRSGFDGACLKCHKDASDAAGVGVTF